MVNWGPVVVDDGALLQVKTSHGGSVNATDRLVIAFRLAASRVPEPPGLDNLFGSDAPCWIGVKHAPQQSTK